MTYDKPQGLREAQIDAYMELIEEGAEIMYLVSDSISTTKISPLLKKYPGRVVNVGIAEQNLLGVAAGLANGGFIPVTGNATTFLISRSNEQLKVDASYTGSNVKVNGMHAGFSYGTDGVTHHEVNDVSTVRGFPGFEIYVPCDARECRLMTRYGVLERKGPVYMSLNSGNFPVIAPESHVFVPGMPLQFREGRDLTVIALGSAVHDALDACAVLKNECSADVFAVTSIRPFLPQAIIDSIRRTGKVLTVEQHSTHGGAGSLIAELIADNGLGARLLRLGIPEGRFTQNWIAPDNKKYFGLDGEGIVKSIRMILRG